MPKRTNPFGDHSSLQLKTHVGIKEVDKGVCQQVRMQSVYERTRNLLYNGMRHMGEQAQGQAVLDANENVMHAPNEHSHDRSGRSDLKQLQLGKNCELLVGKDPCSSSSCADMEMDCGNSEPGYASSGNSECHLNVEMPDDCGQFCLPRADLGLRNIDQASPARCSPLHESMGTAAATPLNAFQQMFKAQSKTVTQSTLLESFTGACHNCRKSVSSREVMKCQFCENYVCGMCTRQCKGCHMHFCQLCSMMNYDEATERAFCLSCCKM